MVRTFKASRSDVLLSSARYFCRYQIPEAMAGLALLVLILLLPFIAVLLF